MKLNKSCCAGIGDSVTSDSRLEAAQQASPNRAEGVVKTYDLLNTSRGYESYYDMVESVDHNGNPDGLGAWVRKEDYDTKAKP